VEDGFSDLEVPPEASDKDASLHLKTVLTTMSLMKVTCLM
jgi:hypothetical protein